MHPNLIHTDPHINPLAAGLNAPSGCAHATDIASRFVSDRDRVIAEANTHNFWFDFFRASK